VVTRFLGIDIGTTFLKGAVLDLDNHTVSQTRRLPVPEPVSGLAPTRYELAPEAILATVRKLVGELLQTAPDSSGLVICSQVHCLVLLDDRGSPRSNIITWKDQRALEPSLKKTGSLFDELARLVSPEEQRQLGGEMRVGVPITTLYSLRERGELPDNLYPSSLSDFVVTALCHVEPTTEATLASAHGFFNIERNDWHRELIVRLGFASLRWPRIRRSGEEVGVAEIDGHRLRCFTPIGDQQCALLGAELQEGELSLNISTGSQVSLISRDLPSGDFQVRPYFDDKWLRTIVSVPAGRSLGLLVDLLMEIGRTTDQFHPNPWEYIRNAIDRVGTTDLEVDLSFFASLTGGRGSITNIHEGNLTIGHLFAAAFRTMAGNYARCARILSSGNDWHRVVFSGGLGLGFARLRKEILSKLGDPPYRLCATEEDTLEGLLVFATRVCHQPPSAVGPHAAERGLGSKGYEGNEGHARD
jgi:sugar (pentulose or hexulose) kinase